jgi:hypothetical protein
MIFSDNRKYGGKKIDKEKKMGKKMKIEKNGFSQENAA